MIRIFFICTLFLFSKRIIASKNIINDDSVLFYVKIETYKNIPDSVLKLIELNKLDSFLITSRAGIDLYDIMTKESYKCYELALKKQKEYFDMGYKFAYIIPFHNGIRIPVEEAKKLSKYECEKQK
jgi:hypothetical protein